VRYTSDGSGILPELWIFVEDTTDEEQLCLYDIQCVAHYEEYVGPWTTTLGNFNNTLNHNFGAKADYKCGLARAFDIGNWATNVDGPLPQVVSMVCGDDGDWIYDSPAKIANKTWNEIDASGGIPACKCKNFITST